MNQCQNPLEFLLIGEPNTGKTSTIATLCEIEIDDISEMEGSTKDITNHTFELKETKLATIIDSPGFQNLD